MTQSVDPSPMQAILGLLPHPGGFNAGIAEWMLNTMRYPTASFLHTLCAGYNQAELTCIANILMNEYEDSQFKDRASNADVVVFLLIAAPLLADEHIVRAISRDGVAVRKVIASMLMSRYSDDEFTNWNNSEAALDHIHRVRGTFLHSTILAPQFDSEPDSLWLGKNYRKVLPLLPQLKERQSVDPLLIEKLHTSPSSALREGIL